MYLNIGEKKSVLFINKQDISKYCIVIHSESFRGPSTAPTYIDKAAEVLQKYLLVLTGVNVPIYFDTYPLFKKYKINVGFDCYINPDKYGLDEYYFSIKENDVCFDGGQRGILYGIYTFLEKYLGFRFLTKNVEKIKYSKVIRLTDLEERFNPIFEYREICDFNAWNPDFSVKCKLNGNFVRKLRDEDGGSYGFAGGFGGLVHTFGRLLPQDKYFKKNPNLFAFVDGIRNPGGVCFSNKETVDTIVKEAISWLNKEKNPSLISISINDGEMVYCHCPECEKKYKKGYKESDFIIELVNKVSEEIHKKFPKVQVETLIYHDTVTPPNVVKPNKDIVLRYCPHSVRKMSIEKAHDTYLKTKDPALQLAYQTVETLKTWSSFPNKLYIWDYPYNYHLHNLPFPILHSLPINMRYFVKHNAKGMYINGEADSADFYDLRVYLLSKLMFDPLMSDKTYEQHLDDFLEGFYGKGWKNIKEYILYTEKLSKPYVTTASGPFDIIPEKHSNEFISKSRKLFANALKATDIFEEKQRIKKASLVVDHFDLFANFDKARMSNNSNLFSDYVKLYKKHYHDLTDFGISRICENIFLPVVRNFKQSPYETIFWELKGKCYQDRNNERYSRKLYLLISSKEKLGKFVDKEILVKTNNESKNGFINVFNNGKFISSEINPKWHADGEYRKIKISGTITNIYEISKLLNLKLNSLELQYVPRHLNGIFIEMNEMDPGAYITFKEIEK